MTWGDDHLKVEELTPSGGNWSGVLFENARSGFPLSLTWSFQFTFAPVSRDFGHTDPNLMLDWVAFPGASWRRMAGQRASESGYSAMIGSSMYFFDHHRFDSSGVVVVEQDGTRILARADLAGDVDELGLAAVSASSWLEFDGIYVQPESRPVSVEAARELLERFTETDGLHGTESSHNFVFRPEIG